MTNASLGPVSSDEVLPYEHTQIGYIPLGIGAMYVGLIVPLCGLWRAVPADVWIGVLVFSPVVLGGVFFFQSFTIAVQRDRLTWHFGPCIWTTVLRCDEIQQVDTVRHSVRTGIGIQWLGWGWWYYGVHGCEAVEIETTSGTVLRLGTDEPEALRCALDRACSPT